MEVPFTWKVTGWFMIGWSPEFPIGEVRPLHYFGEDLVAYRDESGEHFAHQRQRLVKPELAELVAPAHTAIVTQECQGAVMGPNAGLAVLAAEARREALPNIVRLLPAARDAGVRVVHCLVQRQAGRPGRQPQRAAVRRRRQGGGHHPG